MSADPQAVGTVSVEHGVSAPVIPVMPHAAVCASTASMSARIRHEWPDRLWTVRILRPRKGGIRTCFRSPTGRGNSLRNCPVRVRIPAKAPAEATASTPPDPVRTSAGTGTMLRQVLSITGIRNRCSARFRSYSCGIRCQRRHPPAAISGRDGTMVTAQACTSAA